MAGRADPGDRARRFAYRVKSAEVIAALHQAGVRPVVLKGLAFEELLYPDADRRPSSDLDLMIPAHSRESAAAALRANGYEPTFLPRDDAIRRVLHAEAWRRESDSSWLDLHLTMPEVACSPEASWRALAPHLVPFAVRGVSALALDRPASALLAALHAAHHGPAAGPETGEDLLRALVLLEREEWLAVARLAQTLGALEALGDGLTTVPAGRRLARQIGAGTDISRRRRLLWADAPWGAVVLEDLAHSSPLRRLRVAVRLLSPAPRALRSRSRLARRGVPGLVLAYLIRPLILLGKLPGALLVWRRTCRTGGSSVDGIHAETYDGASRRDAADSER